MANSSTEQEANCLSILKEFCAVSSLENSDHFCFLPDNREVLQLLCTVIDANKVFEGSGMEVV